MYSEALSNGQDNNQTVPTITTHLAQLVKNSTTDTTTPAGIEINRKMIHEVETIYQQIVEDDDLLQFFQSSEMPSTVLSNFLYCVNVLATYYGREAHDGHKMQKVLQKAESILSAFTMNHGNTDFYTSISSEKAREFEAQYKQLNVLGFAELYTKLIYLYGRSYIYIGDFDQGERFFQEFEFFGKKDNLFEGHLSERNGLGLVRDKRISQATKDGQLDKAKELIKQSLEMYARLKSATMNYREDYSRNNATIDHFILK